MFSVNPWAKVQYLGKRFHENRTRSEANIVVKGMLIIKNYRYVKKHLVVSETQQLSIIPSISSLW